MQVAKLLFQRDSCKTGKLSQEMFVMYSTLQNSSQMSGMVQQTTSSTVHTTSEGPPAAGLTFLRKLCNSWSNSFFSFSSLSLRNLSSTNHANKQDSSLNRI